MVKTGDENPGNRTSEINKAANMRRMDGLVSIGDHVKITVASQMMITTLKLEGFESEEIYNYICSVVQEAGN